MSYLVTDMPNKSFYLEQLKKKTPLYPLGKDDPKKKLGVMEKYTRQAAFRGNKPKLDEIKEATDNKGWTLK